MNATVEAEAAVLKQVYVPINSESDVVLARQKARELAAESGFSPNDLALITTAVSELVRNIVRYAGRGEIVLHLVEDDHRRGLVVTARDNGPGIRDIARALQDGYSTSGGLGIGLPGVRRLMDEFEIASEIGKGTTVTVTKWLPL